MLDLLESMGTHISLGYNVREKDGKWHARSDELEEMGIGDSVESAVNDMVCRHIRDLKEKVSSSAKQLEMNSIEYANACVKFGVANV